MLVLITMKIGWPTVTFSAEITKLGSTGTGSTVNVWLVYDALNVSVAVKFIIAL